MDAKLLSPAAPAAVRRYEYRCVDKSIATPWLRRCVWGPLVPYIPAGVTPNQITAVANVCSFAAFGALLAWREWGGAGWLVAAAFGLLLYLSLDNIDGMHAKRTGQSSARGELLDHWSDGVSVGLALLGCVWVVRMPAPLAFALLALGAASYFATMWEQRHTGILRLGAAGATEALLLLAGLYLAMAAGATDVLTVRPLWNDYPVTTIVGALACLGLATAPVEAWWRVRAEAGDWLPLALSTGGLLVAWWSTGIEPAPVLALLALFPALFGGPQQIAYLCGGPPRRWEPVVAAGLGVLVVAAYADLGARGLNAGAWTLVGYAVVRLARDLRRAERRLARANPA